MKPCGGFHRFPRAEQRAAVQIAFFVDEVIAAAVQEYGSPYLVYSSFPAARFVQAVLSATCSDRETVGAASVLTSDAAPAEVRRFFGGTASADAETGGRASSSSPESREAAVLPLTGTSAGRARASSTRSAVQYSSSSSGPSCASSNATEGS